MLESSNFVYRYRLYQVISLTIANYPQVGVVRSRASVFNCGASIISFETGEARHSKFGVYINIYEH